jgi:hypothetical protein
MQRSWLLSLVILSLLLTPCFVHADVLANPGFETGDFTSWGQYVGTGMSTSVVTSWPGMTSAHGPAEGSYFAVIGGNNAPNSLTAIAQTRSLTQGQVLSGRAALDSHGPANSGAGAFVWLYSHSTEEYFFPWSASDGGDSLLGGVVSDVMHKYPAVSGAWTYWQFTVPTTGDYDFMFDVVGPKDAEAYGLLDAQTPEPGTCALLLMGLPGLVWFRRRRA